MRAVFWEAEVDCMERLRPSRPRTMMSIALARGGGGGLRKGGCSLRRASARPLLPLSPHGVHQLLGVKAADRALEIPAQPGSVLGCGSLHWDTYPDTPPPPRFPRLSGFALT